MNRKTLMSESYSSITLRLVDAHHLDNFDDANIRISLDLGGEYPTEFESDGLSLDIELFDSQQRTMHTDGNTKRLRLHFNEGQMYGFYKAIKFYIEEWDQVKEDHKQKST